MHQPNVILSNLCRELITYIFNTSYIHTRAGPQMTAFASYLTITLSYNAELIFYSNFTIIFAGCIITLHLLNIFAQMLSFSSSHTYIT